VALPIAPRPTTIASNVRSSLASTVQQPKD
jgi:hypothetical protein